jgi:hypothetical protein
MCGLRSLRCVGSSANLQVVVQEQGAVDPSECVQIVAAATQRCCFLNRPHVST